MCRMATASNLHNRGVHHCHSPSSMSRASLPCTPGAVVQSLDNFVHMGQSQSRKIEHLPADEFCDLALQTGYWSETCPILKRPRLLGSDCDTFSHPPSQTLPTSSIAAYSHHQRHSILSGDYDSQSSASDLPPFNRSPQADGAAAGYVAPPLYSHDGRHHQDPQPHIIEPRPACCAGARVAPSQHRPPPYVVLPPSSSCGSFWRPYSHASAAPQIQPSCASLQHPRLQPSQPTTQPALGVTQPHFFVADPCGPPHSRLAWLQPQPQRLFRCVPYETPPAAPPLLHHLHQPVPYQCGRYKAPQPHVIMTCEPGAPILLPPPPTTYPRVVLVPTAPRPPLPRLHSMSYVMLAPVPPPMRSAVQTCQTVASIIPPPPASLPYFAPTTPPRDIDSPRECILHLCRALTLSTSYTARLALHIWQRISGLVRLLTSVRPPAHTRQHPAAITAAAAHTERLYVVSAVWLAAKLEERRREVPRVQTLAMAAGTLPNVLVAAEVQVLMWCEWAPYTGFVPDESRSAAAVREGSMSIGMPGPRNVLD